MPPSTSLLSGDPRTTRVAVVQAAAAPFDSSRAVERIRSAAREAAEAGAQLVLFPEAYVGGYPWGLRFGTAVGGRSDAGKAAFGLYWNSAIPIPGPESDALAELAGELGILLVVGVVERVEGRGGTLYCTMAYYGPGGSLLGIHRKLKPTASERLLWGEGDGSTLPVFDEGLGRVGGLICWENYMPLARMALYARGVEIYLAPTADARDRWQSTLRHIALEGRCFVLGCNQYVRRSDYPEGLPIARELEGWPEVLCEGGSAIYGPDGECLAGPLLGDAGILHAELDLSEIARQRFEFDVVGHYARPDVFRLSVDDRPQTSVDFASTRASEAAELS